MSSLQNIHEKKIRDQNTAIFRTLSIMLTVGALFWGLIALFFDLWEAALIPLMFVGFSTFNFTLAERWASEMWRMRMLVFFSLTLPFAFQTFLGGWQNAGITMLWSIIPLFAIIAYEHGRYAMNWTGLTVLLVILCLGFDDIFVQEYANSVLVGSTSEIMLGMNIVFILVITSILIYRFVHDLELSRKREHQLNQKLAIRNEYLEKSLDYAERIQKSLTPDLKNVREVLDDQFQIINQKENVGGDMVWVGHEGDHVVIALIDCTGHGVPGSLLTMLVNDIMNESVHFMGFTEAKDLVLRLMITMHDRLESSADIWTDNADIGLLSFNKKTGELTYSGCGIDLHVVDSEKSYKIASQSSILTMKQLCDRPQTETRLKLDPTCTKLYMASDGVFDAFGGENNSRYGSERFQTLLSKVSTLPFDLQKKLILKEFDSWRGEGEQTDDLTFIGLEVSQRFLEKSKYENKSVSA